MHHVAIMKPSWKLIPKILSGEKTIESRWYQTRRAPWDGIRKGDTVWFKDSGKDVTAKAVVGEVMQFEIDGLEDARSITDRYGKNICLVDPDPASWRRMPRYAVLIRLKDPKPVKPFAIDKRGFGMATAWLTVSDMVSIKVKRVKLV